MFFLYTLHVMISPENILSQKAALYSPMINPDYDIYHISPNKHLGTYSKEGNYSRGELNFFSLNELKNGLVVPGKFTALLRAQAIG